MSAPTATTAPSISRHRLLPMIGRDPRERHRAATPLELLFDLSFVVAFAQAGDALAHYVAEGHIWSGVIGFGWAVLWVCWAWISFTFFASAFDTDDWLHRILTMVQMVGVVIIALGIPDVFASIDHGETLDFRIMALGYVIMRVAMVAMWVRVARRDPENRRAAIIYIVFTAGAQVGWVAIALMRLENVPVLLAVIGILTLIELAGPIVATWDSRVNKHEWRGTPWHPHHLAERYGLLVIITLGEGILGTVAAVSALVADPEVGWSGEAILVVVAGVGITFGLWWSYFVVPSAHVLARHRNRKWAWGYGHIVLLGAIAAVGAGLHVAAYAVEGHAVIGTLGVVLSVAIPVLIFCVAYFVLYSILFRSVDALHAWLALGMVLFLVAGVALAAVAVPLGWCLLVVTLSPFVVVVGYETAGYRHVAADVEREAPGD
jgi:low temperature requirement protein LtrA